MGDIQKHMSIRIRTLRSTCSISSTLEADVGIWMLEQKLDWMCMFEVVSQAM